MSTPVPTLFSLRQSDAPALELIFEDPEHFTFTVLPYVFTTGDFINHMERPLFPVCSVEIDPIDAQSFRSVYFLLHPGVICLLPFLRLPACANFASLEYLADLLDSAVPAFDFGADAFPPNPAYSTPAVLELVSYINDPKARPSTVAIVRTLSRCRTFFNTFRQVWVMAAISTILVDAFANSIHSVISALPLQLRNQDWLDTLPAIPEGEFIPLPGSFSFPTTPHWTEDPDPFPLFDDESISDPLSLAWEAFMNECHALLCHQLPLSPDKQIQDPPAYIILSPVADPVDAVPSPPIANPTPPRENETPQPPETAEDPPFLSLDTPAPPKTSVTVPLLQLAGERLPPSKKPKPKKSSTAPAKRPVIKTRAPCKSENPSEDYIPPVEALDDSESEVPDEDNLQGDPLCDSNRVV
ncbi:hypothetical protein C8R45DRAFT_1087594 [Mycena sanguinolenta]|nr:hypothetical protein C8R45DRAFT_1087594 [Mycena sanguinolenta]